MQPVNVDFAVDRPIDEVFEVISDIAHYNEWAPHSSMVYLGTTITSDKTKGLDTIFVDKMRFGGKSLGKITRYDPPERFAIDQRTYIVFPLFSAHIDYELVSEGQTTRVSHTVTPNTHGLYKLLGPIHRFLLVKERKAFCRAIVQKLEGKDVNG